MNQKFAERIKAELEAIKDSGLYKTERVIASAQGAEIIVNGKTVLNFCANNYLGLSSHPSVMEAACRTIDRRGYGLSSVRFICGTQDIHKELEQKIESFQGLQVMQPLMRHAVYFAGITDVTMPRGVGWCFMNLGKYVERCLQTLLFTEKTTGGDPLPRV